MAVDMGGPVNKAAYVFGLASLQTGNYDIMAAIMAGGMVPPLAIALSTTFFPKKYTKRERDSGITNYIMGLSFITEGAIPFAAADPIRVIPSIIAGSAVAGGLSMLFGCMLRAPSWWYLRSSYNFQPIRLSDCNRSWICCGYGNLVSS